MTNNLNDEQFTGFDYPISQLSKYIRAGDIFTILLKNGSIISVSATEEFLSAKLNQDLFEQWLADHSITNIKS